jgi:hypothetical protein
LKLLLLVVLVALTVALILRSPAPAVDASVTGPLVASNTEMPSGGVVTIKVPLAGGADPLEATQIQVTGVSAPIGADLTGTLVVQSCAPSCVGDVGKTGLTVVVDENNLTEITLGLQLLCNVDWVARVTAEPGEGDQQSVDIMCAPGGDGGGLEDDDHAVELLGAAQVVVTAHPNLLPCEGGTTTLTAEVLDAFGNHIPGVEFRFFTTAGTIVQTSPTTAKLTLGPNQYFAEVTATIPDAIAGEVDEAVTTVGLSCTGDGTNQTLVVTANPNVVQCTGTTTITATVRDVNGHVVPGRGFHFVTSAGLLQVSPNNASTEEGVATLTLRPGDGDATVAVSSGLLHGTYEELDGSEDVEDDFVVDETAMVTVKQNCLGTTTGQIRVNSSAVNLHCGERVFIGLSVIDEDIQTVIDNTPLTLIASGGGNGGFFVGVGNGGNGSTTSGELLLPQVSVQTSHGEANAIYVAPTDYNGEVKITAASGDTYGIKTLTVNGCAGTAPPPSSSTGTGAIPCTPIGDGICITPPNTGANRITPPSTGSAGLR